MHGTGVILTLFVQVTLILAVTRVLGWIFSRIRQPQMLGEMIGGVMLGPSLLGWTAPGVFGRVFPHDSVQSLAMLGQIGVIFFVFLMGLQIEVGQLKVKGKQIVAIAGATMVTPFWLGLVFARLFYGQEFSWVTAVFAGAALSISAFTVLGRILGARNLHRLEVGVISLSVGAVSIVAVWGVLAIALAARNWKTALGMAVFVAVLILIVRPFLKRLQLIFEQHGKLGQNMLALMIFLVLASALVTHRIGLSGVLGAFGLGLVMPRNRQFARQLCAKLEDFVIVFLLPIFFAWIGLSMDITLLNSPSMWGWMLLILVLAIGGKFGSAFFTAHFLKMPARDSAAIGILLNTRGLMALILLGIGLGLSLITPELFVMLVLVTLITMGLTTPLLNLVYPARLLARSEVRAEGFSILIPISLPKSGGPLVQLADALIGNQRQSGRLYALHLRRPAEHEAMHPHDDESLSQAALIPLLSQAKARALPVEPISFISGDVPADIASTAASHGVNLILMGYHNPIFGKAMLGGTVHRVLSAAATHVAIFVDRGLRTVDRILVPYLGSPHDSLALELAAKMARNSSAQVTVLNIVPPLLGQAGKSAETRRQVEKYFDDPAERSSMSFQIVEDSSPVGVVLHQAQNFDLVIIGVAEEWGLESRLFGWRPEKIARDCPASLLIVRRFSPPQEIPVSNAIPATNPPGNPRVAM